MLLLEMELFLYLGVAVCKNTLTNVILYLFQTTQFSGRARIPEI